MSMQDLERGLDLVDEHSDEADFEGPRSMTLIAAAEQALGLDFPPTYSRFLRELGCGDIGGEEFYGVIGGDFVNSSVPDAIWATLMERESGLPRSLIVVGSVGDGSLFALDTFSRDANGECPVVVWRPGQQAAHEFQRVADDFGEFFKRSVAQAVGR